MKKVLVFVLCSLFLVPLKAVDYCAPSSWGYAGNVTGGGNATPTLVSSVSQLDAALGGNQKPKNKVVIITQDLTFSEMLTIQDAQNITIMALPGVKLINNSTTKTDTKDYTGILFIKRTSNIILRNLTFIGPGAYDIDGSDNLCFEKVTNAWVDHCDFQDGLDGNFDIKSTTDNITVTWCRFRYLKTPIPGGSGGSNDHRFSNLVGSDSNDKPTDGTYNITYAFCWWDQGCKQRMTRCRNALIHYLNCYWNSSVSDYYIGPENASGYFEGCTFAGRANTLNNIWQPFNNTTNYCTFVNCTGNLPDNSSTPVAAPTYAYDQLTPATAKSYVINTSCGAGATLTVTTAAEVSSACDGGDTPVVPTDPVAYSGDCCINLGLGEAPSVANGGLEDEVFSQLIISYAFNHASSGWAQGYLNLGSNNDTITFDFSNYYSVIDNVAFDVTIPNWETTKNTISYRWNKEGAYTKYTISSNALQTVSLTAPANAHSFTIKRSASTGTQIQGICFQLEESIPTATALPQTKSAAHKVLRNGHVLILREGKTYDLLGNEL